MLVKEIKDLIFQAVNKDKRLDIEQIADFSIEMCPESVAGDLSTNLAFLLAKKMKMSPVKIGKLIVDVIKNDKALSEIVQDVEIVGKGFINFFIFKDKFYEELLEISQKKENYGRQDIGQNKKIQIEFVSANPTGPLHIGHGRGAAIGDSLSRILQDAGYDVQKEYYINNRGTQIDLLGESVRARYKELHGEKIEFPEQGYKGDYIKDIANKILTQDIRIEEENKFFKEFAVRYILEEIKKDLKDFDVQYNRWFCESDLYRDNEVEQVIKKLKETNFIYEKDNAVWFRSTAFGDEKDRVVIRSDIQPTYLASDITYHYDKFKRGFEKVIDIWGADHHGYVSRVEASIQALGYSKDRLKVILYQLVSLSRGGNPQAMSTRSGEFVTLRQVIDEVGKDACRFFFLIRGENSHLDFDLELAKKQSPDNPVYYVQYAHARICSIFKEAEKLDSDYRLVMEDTNRCMENLRLLIEDEEVNLIKKLSYFPELIALSARTYDPHWVTVYLLELAKFFHNYYQKHRVISEHRNLTSARLFLIQATKIILSKGLYLIGVSAPEKM